MVLLQLCAAVRYNALGAGHDASQDQRAVQGLYAIAAQLNHSCTPNAVFYLDPNAPCGTEAALCHAPLVVRAVRDLEEGTEVTLAYTELLQPRAGRQRWLKDHYGFDCRCARCVLEGEESGGDPLTQRASAGVDKAQAAAAEAAFEALPYDASTETLLQWLEVTAAGVLHHDHVCCHEARLMLAQHLAQRGEAAQAARLYEDVLRVAKVVYPPHWPTLPTLHWRLYACYKAVASAEREGALTGEAAAAAAELHRAAFEAERAMCRGQRCGACKRALWLARACSACHTAHYCDAACQRRHWPQHKRECQNVVRYK